MASFFCWVIYIWPTNNLYFFQCEISLENKAVTGSSVSIYLLTIERCRIDNKNGCAYYEVVESAFDKMLTCSLPATLFYFIQKGSVTCGKIN